MVINKFSIVELKCWICNICGKATYANKVNHKCWFVPPILSVSKLIRINNLDLKRRRAKKFLTDLIMGRKKQ